ncbi:MAG: glycosyltransferase family 39 protein [Candidatus ainarchaeum sp.]|nr:glycosyltransferase family 39 protein [Candidatus ainarchaeum sp.]
MALLGINIFSLHLLALFFSCLALVLFFCFLKNHFDLKIAVAFAILFVFNFINLEYSKLALLEIFVNLFLVCSFILLVAFLKNKKESFLYLSAILFVLALIIKPTAIFFTGIFFVSFLLDRKSFSKKSILICSGIILSGIIYSFAFDAVFNTINRSAISDRIVKDTAQFIRALVLIPRNRFVIFNIFAEIFALITIVSFIKRTKFKPKNFSHQDRIIVLLFAWIVLFLIEMILSNYQPSRYFLVLTLPLLGLASLAFYKNNSKYLYGLLFLAIAANLFFFFAWQPTYTIQTANSELKNFDGNVLCGGGGKIIFFEAPKANCFSGGVQPADPKIIRYLGIQYLVDMEPNAKKYENSFSLEKIKEFTFGGCSNFQLLPTCYSYKIGLYKITDLQTQDSANN